MARLETEAERNTRMRQLKPLTTSIKRKQPRQTPGASRKIDRGVSGESVDLVSKLSYVDFS